MKSEKERERYIQLNAEFQRIARRDKKSFLNEQCKVIEKNNRMGKSRVHFKKIRDIKEIFHARMGMIKNRNNKDLSEAEEIKKRWQEYTEELCKKVEKNNRMGKSRDLLKKIGEIKGTFHARMGKTKDRKV